MRVSRFQIPISEADLWYTLRLVSSCKYILCISKEWECPVGLGLLLVFIDIKTAIVQYNKAHLPCSTHTSSHHNIMNTHVMWQYTNIITEWTCEVVTGLPTSKVSTVDANYTLPPPLHCLMCVWENNKLSKYLCLRVCVVSQNRPTLFPGQMS